MKLNLRKLFRVAKVAVGIVNPPVGVALEAASAVVKVAKHNKRIAMAKEVAPAPVKSAWKSKVNWVAAIPLLYGVMEVIGVPVPEGIKGPLQEILMTVVPIVVIVLRTWFTKSLTKGSV